MYTVSQSHSRPLHDRLNGGLSRGATMFLLSLLLASCSRIGQAQIAPPFTSIYQFSAVEFNGGICLNTDGADIRAGLVQDADGNLYGTASMGGSVNAGTVFKLTTTGVLTPLHNFSEYGRDGCLPYCHDRGLVLGEDGNLYGTTEYGGVGHGAAGKGRFERLGEPQCDLGRGLGDRRTDGR